jgi:Ca-activated chloride channel family protein
MQQKNNLSNFMLIGENVSGRIRTPLVGFCILGVSFAVSGCSNVSSPYVDQAQIQYKKSSQPVLMKSMAINEAVIANTSADYLHEEQQLLSSEKYKSINRNKFTDPSIVPVSIFGVDVDTASFANVRRFINQGRLPNKNAVRTEEIVNYFNYSYPQPSVNEGLIKLNYEMAVSPWNSKSKLLSVSLQAKDSVVDAGSNMVFLIDVSGSMAGQDKLPLLKKSLKLLVGQLDDHDCISIVTYAGNANVELKATAGSKKQRINQAIDRLNAGGSTNGENGLSLAYELASSHYIKGGVNSIVLATDGDFNLGMSDPSNMKKFIEEQRESGVNLSVLGFGQGNYNDHLMEELSNAGNGNAAYIDTLQEAHKVLVDQAKKNFNTLVYDAKLQVEFNPSVVSAYRLLGYENRALKQQDFVDDKKDAGDIGANQSVTAIYEIIYNGDEWVAPLRYQQNKNRLLDKKQELGFIKIRYKDSRKAPSKEYSLAVNQADLKPINKTSNAYRLAVSAAAYAEKLSESQAVKNMSFSKIINLAKHAKGEDEFGYRSSFIQQLRLSEKLLLNK